MASGKEDGFAAKSKADGKVNGWTRYTESCDKGDGMSQRNPMNDRYQTDERKGQTRRSAASVKPKTKAASSVRVVSATKTPQQKKAAKKAERQKQQAESMQYQTPPTEEFKKWRKIWWGLLIGAIVMVALSFAARMMFPEMEVLTLVILGVGYVGIIGALLVDFLKIRKLRRAYQQEMQGKVSKEQRAAEKRERAAAAQAKKEAEQAAEAKETTQDEGVIQRRKGLFSFSGLRGSAERASEKNKAAAKAQEETTDK